MDGRIRHYEDKLSYETDSWDLNEAIQNGERIVVIDARSSEAFEEEHIPGAVSLPHRTMCQETTTHMDREVLYVTYCDGIGCNASTKGALKMAQLGFRVKELIGGLDWWKRDGYPTENCETGSESKSMSSARKNFLGSVSTENNVISFEVRCSQNGERHLTISESNQANDYYRHNRIVVFEENIESFLSGLDKAIKSLRLPGQPESYSVKEIRRNHPRAYEKWSSEEDEELKKRHSMGLSPSELAKHFQRKPGAIQSRLTKLGLK